MAASLPATPRAPISGSVIQRTFLGADLPEALFAASVPLTEVAAEGMDLRRLLAEILGVPSGTIVDEQQYRDVVGALSDPPFLDWSILQDIVPSPTPFFVEWSSTLQRERESLSFEMQSSRNAILPFAEHSIALMLAGGQIGPHILDGFVGPEEMQQFLNFEINDVALRTAVSCMTARLRVSRQADQFTKAVLNYDVPYGNSPRASSDSLFQLLDTGKKMCLGPMAAGGTLGVTQLSQGHYVAAILSAGTGSLISLILLGSVAVGSLLVARLAQRRGDSPSTQGTPTPKPEANPRRPTRKISYRRAP